MTQQHLLHLTRLLVEDMLVVEDGVPGLHDPSRQLRRRRVEDEVSELLDMLPVTVVVEVVALTPSNSQTVTTSLFLSPDPPAAPASQNICWDEPSSPRNPHLL